MANAFDKLDKQANPFDQFDEQPQQGGGVLNELGRQLGLTGRAIAGGAAQMAEPFTEPVRYLMNKALPGNPVGNIEAATDQALTDMGVPEPKNRTERGVQSVARFATGFAVGMGGANKVDDLVMDAIKLSKPSKIDPPTTAQLKELATAAYKQADDAKLVVTPDSFERFAKRLAAVARKEGIDKGVHPKSTAVINRFLEEAENGAPLTLQELEILRRVAAGAGKTLDADEARLSGIIIDQLDDYIARLGSMDIAAGDAKAGAAALNTARDLWKRMSRAKVIEDAVERAGINAETYTGAGFENALRVQFKQIARNKRIMRGFSEQEREAIKKVAMGGPIDNAFRYLGKLAPTGVVSTGLTGGVSYMVGGMPLAVAVPAAGMAGRQAATRLTMKNVDTAYEMARRGSPAAKEGVPDWLLPWMSGAMFGADTQGD